MNCDSPHWMYTPVSVNCTGCGGVVTKGNRFFLYPKCGSLFCVAPACGPEQVKHVIRLRTEKMQARHLATANA